MPDSAAVLLRFDRPAPTDANLVFGAEPAAPADALTLSVQASLPGLSAAVVVRPSVPLSLGGSTSALGGVTFHGEVRYASQTQRPLVGKQRHGWQLAVPTDTGASADQQGTAQAPAGRSAHWQQPASRRHGVEHRLPPTLAAMPEQRSAGHRDATGTRAARAFAHQEAARVVLMRRDGVQTGAGLQDLTRFRHQDADRHRRAERAGSWQMARPLGQPRGGLYRGAAPAPGTRGGCYQRAVPPPPGISIWVAPQPPGRSPCYVPSPHLLFSDGRPDGPPWDLFFHCERALPTGARWVVPVRRVYIVFNSVTMRRVDGDIELPVESGSMALDAGSWTWSFSAVLPATALAHVRRAAGEPPVEIEVAVNGVPYRLRVLQIGRDRQFGADRIRVSGQGQAALLAAPHAAAMTFGTPALTSARQLADAVLTINGVPLGWTVDWGIADWSVPAGAWAFQGTYIEAINDIAAAAGAYVQPHETGQVLRILPRYPRAPWAWGELTPDVELPAGAVQVEGTEWVDGPGYDRVFVGGLNAGVFGPVTITGTAGSSIAPQVAHALITAPEAHRQRGLAELAAAASRVERQLKLQVLPETGILVPGVVLDYVDGAGTSRGIVRSTRVDWAGVGLRQTLGVEYHEVA